MTLKHFFSNSILLDKSADSDPKSGGERMRQCALARAEADDVTSASILSVNSKRGDAGETDGRGIRRLLSAPVNTLTLRL